MTLSNSTSIQLFFSQAVCSPGAICTAYFGVFYTVLLFHPILLLTFGDFPFCTFIFWSCTIINFGSVTHSVPLFRSVLLFRASE